MEVSGKYAVKNCDEALGEWNCDIMEVKMYSTDLSNKRNP
jgi:hypothetical protein